MVPRRPRRWVQIAVGTVFVVFVLGSVLDVISNFRWDSPLRFFTPVYLCVFAWIHFRTLRADRDGITRRDTLRATPWSQVDALIEPGRWDTTVHLRMSGGKDSPTGYPAEHLERLVELSGKPVERRPSTSSTAEVGSSRRE
ncbi:hypothetical protein [Allobranchiibius sp. CTAmp26]|uniref:hypothetical protein n=1 Tax=Allobranchiibius sp. CTAmp26 TaxID=2815214 RepID=UPI001AA1CDEB|nr:hypothetical protein [Allobranchiibius sp. CTAmp26]MBO1756668.1 hypothetical protein [Allobranchiibius sp. CTAmp26]